LTAVPVMALPRGIPQILQVQRLSSMFGVTSLHCFPKLFRTLPQTPPDCIAVQNAETRAGGGTKRGSTAGFDP
jgi:hypothetical protein